LPVSNNACVAAQRKPFTILVWYNDKRYTLYVKTTIREVYPIRLSGWASRHRDRKAICGGAQHPFADAGYGSSFRNAASHCQTRNSFRTLVRNCWVTRRPVAPYHNELHAQERRDEWAVVE